MKRHLLIPVLFVVAGVSVACSKTDKTSALPADVQQAARSAPATPAAPAAATVDVCSMLSQADAEAIIGTLSEAPAPSGPATGSLLGDCDYKSVDVKSTPIKVLIASVSARPAREFDGTVNVGAKKSPPKAVTGLGEKAFDTAYGLMIQPAGKPYFITVFTAGADGKATSLAIAKKLKM